MKDDLIKASAFSSLFYSIAGPTVQKVLITSITEKYIAVNSIIICLSAILLGKLWNKYGSKLYKYYAIFLLLESLFYAIIIALMLTSIINQRTYYIVDTFLYALISKNIIFGGNKLKVIRYKDEARNKYDNDVTIAINVACLTGYVVSLVIGIPEMMAFIFLAIGVSIDNVFYYKAFKESK